MSGAEQSQTRKPDPSKWYSTVEGPVIVDSCMKQDERLRRHHHSKAAFSGVIDRSSSSSFS